MADGGEIMCGLLVAAVTGVKGTSVSEEDVSTVMSAERVLLASDKMEATTLGRRSCGSSGS